MSEYFWIEPHHVVHDTTGKKNAFYILDAFKIYLRFKRRMLVWFKLSDQVGYLNITLGRRFSGSSTTNFAMK